MISDNVRRARQWQRLVGEFFPPRLGGDATAWSTANRDRVPPLLQEFATIARPDVWFRVGYEQYLRRWVAIMCEAVGFKCPPMTKHRSWPGRPRGASLNVKLPRFPE